MSAATTYIVKAGDTLKSIATMQIGDDSAWQYLASINKITSPYVILPGQVLKTEVSEVKQSLSIPWGKLLLIGGGAYALYYFFLKDKKEDKTE